MMITAVAFDMDGLMFDTEDIYDRVGRELMRRRGHDYSEELRHAVMGKPPQQSFETMIQWHSLTDSWQALKAESEALFLEYMKDGFQMMPGLAELLAELEHRRIPKGICTSSSRRIVTEVLNVYNMIPRFKFVMTAEDILFGKPNPEIYLKAAKRLEVEPSRMMVLEDSAAGCRAAADSGAFAVVVLAEHNKNQDFPYASLVADRLDSPQILNRLL
ncbi:MAG: HAD family phosphatase, partial [Planctomycetaceae bacterium]|nr:HAD family phosphatase [Planctomycetaceae bacterium]